MEKYYLAYGSNLNLNQMNLRCKESKIIGATIVKNYRLVYKGICDGFSYLTLEKSNGKYVPLGIYIISSFDELSLDKYEGYPKLYYKEYFDININNKNEKALIYLMHKQFDYHIPSNSYIKTCIRGYDDFDFDKNLLDDALNFSIEQKVKHLKK